jgi:tetratricopeptide (TPR) repeat protein
MISQMPTTNKIDEDQTFRGDELLAVRTNDPGGLPVHPLLPDRAQRDFALGVEFVGTGQPLEAAGHFEKVLQTAPEFADGHVALGMAYAMTSNIYPALDHLERAVQLEPDNFFAHFKLGHLYFKLRIPYKGYKQMDLALECAASFRERQLVAYLIREERKREHKGVRRPWWNKPFSRKALYAAATLGASAGVVLLRILYLH